MRSARFDADDCIAGAYAAAIDQRCFLAGAGMTIPGELARVTGLSRPEAGLGNRALVAEGFATMPARGTYQLALGVNGVGGGNGLTRSNGETEGLF